MYIDNIYSSGNTLYIIKGGIMNFNKVIILGNLTRDPEKKYLPNGDPVTNFSIAVKGYKEDVNYFDIVVFGKQAESCEQYLSKGRPVLVEGRLQQRRWEAKDGTKRSKIEVVASSVIFLGGKQQDDSVDRF
jgi:single-strand DNA-binding protein